MENNNILQNELERMGLPAMLAHNDGTPVTAESWAQRREELLTLLCENEYGYSPNAPDEVRFSIKIKDDSAFAGKALLEQIVVAFDTPKGEFSFPFTLVVPKKAQPVPTFLLLNFRPDIPDIYCPTEELIDNGYAVAQLYYEDVTVDNDKLGMPLPETEKCFTDGLAACYPRDRQTGWGKIGIWAWAASRVMDVLCALPELDHKRIAVVGHSRLGKTALWCSAQDERFSLAVSNDSGCCGAALSRGKTGEKISDITKSFPYWFCGKLSSYAEKENEMPVDQHMLLALTAPRGLLINSASKDEWADPKSEYLSAAAASPVFELLGETGLPEMNREPMPGERLLSGTVAYCLREGTHYLSRTDWLNILEYRAVHNGRF